MNEIHFNAILSNIQNRVAAAGSTQYTVFDIRYALALKCNPPASAF